ncbi:MAG: YaaL family protein [Lachnospiraceae bacterium]|nr:YaaL family protein [Lachnospiraceae bacterium]
MFKRTNPADNPPAELLKLRSEIETTKANLELAMSNFEQAVDPTMIDCYIYEVNAAQLRYQYLLKQAKQYDIDPMQG